VNYKNGFSTRQKCKSILAQEIDQWYFNQEIIRHIAFHEIYLELKVRFCLLAYHIKNVF